MVFEVLKIRHQVKVKDREEDQKRHTIAHAMETQNMLALELYFTLNATTRIMTWIFKSGGERKPKKGKNQIKTAQKREAWRSLEKSETVTVSRGRKTEQNTKRRAENANTCKVYQSFKERKKKEGQKFFDVIVRMDWLSKRKFVIVCHEKAVRILLEGDEILLVHGERTQGVMKTLMNTKVDEPKLSDIFVVRDFNDAFSEGVQTVSRKGCHVSIDDILIYSKTKEEHEVHLKLVLESSDALSRKKRLTSKRVRGMILAAQSEAFNQENLLAERLHGLDQQMERKGDESFLLYGSNLGSIEVIINGDSPVPEPPAVGTVVPPKTKAQKLARKNKLKDKSALLLAIPDEHLLKFHSIKDAKSLWEAIKIRSLPSAWNNIALIMRNKPEIETLSMNDLYNNLKVYKAEIKRQSCSGSNSYNVAFVYFENTSSINETVNVTHDIPTAGSKEQPSASSYADDVMFSFFASQSNTPQIDNEDLEQIDTDDLEEMDLKWNQDNRSANNERRVIQVETPASALVVQDRLGGYAGGNPQYTLQDQGIFDTGCSRHMTGNKSFLIEYQEIDGGFVAFRGSPKGGKITGKGKLKTGKSDFKDVYFVKELKFNLFSISQMCDKKNSVLFTKTECLVLSPDFKLLDESQVLLKVPRQNNMYGFDLKNVVPSGDLTCLFAKATNDESNLWHRRLGHINFKTLNKLVRGNLVRGSGPERLFNIDSLTKSMNYKPVSAGNQSNGDAGSGPEWLFNIDSLTKSMNYEPVSAGNQSNGDAGDVNYGDIQGDVGEISRNDDVCQGNEIRIDSSTHAVNVASRSINTASNIIDAGSLNINIVDSNHINMPTLEATRIFDHSDLGAEADTNNLDSSIVEEGIDYDEVFAPVARIEAIRLFLAFASYMGFLVYQMDVKSAFLYERIDKEVYVTQPKGFVDPQHPKKVYKDVWTLVDLPYGKRVIGSKWVFRNKLDERGIVIRNKARLVAQGHTHEEGIDYDEVFAPVERIEAIRLFLEYASFKDFIVYQMDVKSAFLYGKIEEEVCVRQPPGFEDPDFPDKEYKVKKALYGLNQAPRACQDKYVAEILKKFRFSKVKPMETSKPLLKDEDGQEKKQKPRRKQRKEAEVSHDKSEDEDHVSTPSSDPLPSGEDSSILNELMVLCTNLQEHVLDLQEAKAAQAKEIVALKNKVTKLNKWRKSRSGGLKRLMKFGLVRRVKSSMQKDGLGSQEDASKQDRMIKEIDQNIEIALDDETQGKTNDDEIFGVDDLVGEEVVMETTTIVKDSAAPTTNVTKDEVTMAQALAVLKITTAVPTPKAKGIVFYEQKQSQIPTVSSSKDKGTTKMIEPEVPIKRKEHMRIDEEYARKLEAEEQEATRISRAQQDEEANNSWDNMQAMMDADRLLAKRLQARVREEFSKVEKARLLVELIEKRKKHFAALRAQEKRRKPPTKTQMKSQMSTYLRHIGGYKQSHLKGMSFDEIKKLFDREMTKVNDFVAMDSEAQESSTKRTAEHLEFNISKKQKVDENVKPVIDDFKELRKCIEIVPDDGDDVLIEATPISSRSPTIIDYKIHKEGNKTYFKIIRADDRFKKEKPVDDMDNILFRTLKTMFKHHVEDAIWKYQQGLAKVKNWKLFESCGVHCITMQSIIYYLLVEKVYPLTRNTLHQLWSDVRLQVDYDVEMAYDLLRFIRKQLMEVSAAEGLQLLEEFLLSNG
uniref:Copia protein n=1 Tax=Tanacetum cinerariifolium TaxID=118510 RepID=A0A6L2M0P4_TANCI|nr:copia protein [Tanacetum cinerariifolium]